MFDMNTPINGIEDRAYDISNFISGIEDQWKDVIIAIEKVRETAKYMFDNPDHFTTTDIEQKAGEILEALDGIE